MRRIGYVSNFYNNDYMKEQHEALEKQNLETIIIEEKFNNESNQDYDMLKEILFTLSQGDELVVYELECLGKSIIQLSSFLKELENKKINLIILNKGVLNLDVSDELYIEMILRISESERIVIRERTTKGLQEARRKGRVGGRPKISEETIERIDYLYHNQSYTLREISEECDVSLGTVYKYAQRDF